VFPPLSVRPIEVVVEKLNTKQWTEFPTDGALGVHVHDDEVL
jgi:hypothetical protein